MSEPLYELVLYAHILSAIAWVGGAFFLHLLSMRVGRSADLEEVPRLGRHIAWFGMRYFLPISVTVFVAGLIMVASRWSFSQAWISIAMLLWIVSVLIGAVYIGPKSKRAAELFETEGAASPAARSMSSRLMLVSRIDIAMFFVVVALMVYKPGAG